MAIRRRRRGERGATLVEYALGVALIVVVCILAVGAAEDSADDALDAQADAGNPTEQIGFIGGGPVGSDPGEGTDPGEEEDPPALTIGELTATARAQGGGGATKWRATADIEVLNDGVLQAGVKIYGFWATNSAVLQCTTEGNGNNIGCVSEFPNLPCSTTSITFTVTKLELEDVVVELATPQTVEATAPNTCTN